MLVISKQLQVETVPIRVKVVEIPLIDLPGEFKLDKSPIDVAGDVILNTQTVIVKLNWSESFGPVLSGSSYMRVTNLLIRGYLEYVMDSATEKDIDMFKMLHGDNLYEDIKWLYEP